MSKTMYDSVEPGAIPADAEMVGGYLDGIYAWSQAEWDRFWRAEKVTFSAVGVRWDADLFDVEPGCIWPPENVLSLVVTARANGRWPGVYCNQMQHWAYIRQMFRMRGMEEPPYFVSNYDGDPTIPAGAIGKQYKHPPQTGRHYDLSAVDERWIPGRRESDMDWGDRLTNANGVTFKADEWITWTNFYASEAARDAATAKEEVEGVKELLAQILARLDQGGSDAMVEAAARRAKELIGEDLADESTDSHG